MDRLAGRIPQETAQAQRPDGGRHRSGPALEMGDNVGLPDLSERPAPIEQAGIRRVVIWTSETHVGVKSIWFERAVGADGNAQG